jgi:peptide/nickel transport system permease protein
MGRYIIQRILILIPLLLAIPLGILSAVKRGSFVDKLGMSGALLGVSMPSFWVGIMLMLLFSLQLGWLPSSGRGDGTTVGSIKALILPALTLGMALMGLTTRLMRSSMLEVLGQDYMRTARSKGLRSFVVLNRHGLRNALIPVVTIVGLQFASLLGGAVIVETIFAWPGIGRLAVNAIWRRDYPVIMGTVLVFAIVFILMNLLVDLVYTLIDPRINFD